MITYDADVKQTVEIVSCWETVRQSLPQFAESELPTFEKTGEPWIIVLSAADFVPHTLTSMNHFSPVWQSAHLRKDTYQKLAAATSCHISSLRQLLKRAEESLDSHKGFGKGMIESIESQLHIAENFQKLQGWLFASGYVVTDVPADGDCACWSLLSLMRKDPFISFHDKACKEACQQIREDLVQLWKSVSKKPQWQRFYEELSFDPEQPEVPQTREEEQNLSHSQTSVKSEMLKTPSKRRPQPTIHIDLLTPEKAPEAHHRLEVVCNQKGAIDLKKKKRSEIDIPSASQKRAKLPAAEAAEGDGQVMPPKKEKEDAKVNSSRQAFQTKMENEFPLDEGRQSKRTDIKKKPKDERNEEDKAKGEETAEAEGKQKKKRQRTCKSKVKTAEERKLAAVKAYLASKGITWPFCQKYHRRLGLPGAHECKSLTNLHASLMELEEPSCTTCLAMLKAQSASLEELKMSLEEAVDKEKYPDSPGISQLRKVSAATFLDDIEVEKSTPVPIEPDQSRALDPLDPQNLQMVLFVDPAEGFEKDMQELRIGLLYIIFFIKRVFCDGFHGKARNHICSSFHKNAGGGLCIGSTRS